MLICVTGLHGNEPAGVHAVRRVEQRLRNEGIAVKGEFVALAGNLPALAAGRRFIQEDLNRMWWPDRVESIRRTQRPLEHEEFEMRELHRALDDVVSRATGPVFIFDLHTTSADGLPFAAIEDTLRNRKLAFRFPVPVILGIEEEIGGALMEYLTAKGYVTVTLEGGQHESKRAIDNHESLVWIALAACGLIERRSHPEIDRHEERLRAECRRIPCAFEMRYRHAVGPQDQFRMLPGLSNFEPVRQGEVLAYDKRGAVRSPQSARIIMPLYQEQGEDGFFLGREFNPWWLKLSAFLRNLGLARFAHWLPGVRRHPDEKKGREGWMLVNPGIARLFVVEIFHLLGFRRHPPEGKYLVFSRRKYDW